MPDQKLKEALTFIADSLAELTNSLPKVARKSFADTAGRHMQTIVVATQAPPDGKQVKNTQ